MALVERTPIERNLQFWISKVIVSYLRKNYTLLRPGLPMEETQVKDTRSEVKGNHMLNNDANMSRETRSQKSSRCRSSLLGRLF